MNVSQGGCACTDGDRVPGPDSAGHENTAPAPAQPQDDRLAKALEALNDTWARALEELTLAERMHERITELQTDQVHALLSPIARHLIRLREQILDTAGQCATAPVPHLGDQLDFFAEGLQDALEMLGVEEVVPQVGTPFDRLRQRAVERISTPHAEKDRTIAGTVRTGHAFVGAGSALKPADISVYVYDPQLAATASADDEAASAPA